MFIYLYPQVDRTQTFLWNITAELKFQTGLECTTSDVATGDGIKTAFKFNQELTPQQKAILDALVAGGENYPVVLAETVFEIDDLWEQLTQVLTNMGLDPAQCRLRFGDMQGIKTMKMRLYCGKLLTKQEKSKVVDAYANLIREV